MRTRVSIQNVLRSLALAMILLSCQQQTSDGRLSGVELSPPLFGDAMQPCLFAAENELYMSWTEVDEQGISSLLMSSFSDGAWGERIELAKGKDWFVNWADFPSVSKNGKAFVSHFLKKSDTATFSYDVLYLQSQDDGRNWSEPVKMHSDTVRAEHGFVSFAPDGPGSFMAVWLDGRDAPTEEELESYVAHVGHGGNGAM